MNDRTFIPDEARFPWLRFSFAVAINVGIAISCYYLIASTRLKLELTMSFPAFIAVVFLLGLPLSFFEYLYHRYLLHAKVLPFMSAQARAHGKHHHLTNVKAPRLPAEPKKLVPVDNKYAVETEEQEESMMFPLWSLPVFFGIFFSVLGIPLFLLFPGLPIGIALMTAIVLYYCGYEVWHAIIHLPFERFWSHKLYESRFKRVWCYIYLFHLMHHLVMKSNESVVGFWGLALWDHVFRTHKRAAHMPVVGGQVTYEDMELPMPRAFIRYLDTKTKTFESASRKIEDLGRNILIALGLLKRSM